MPPGLLGAMLRADSTRPRLTSYDNAPGPSAGERVELSARVLGNWVAKAGNCLQDELDAGRGTSVLLALPTHWRAVYWALAVWSVGATVRLAPGEDALASAPDCDVVVSDEVDVVAAAQGPSVLVSLPMLSRSHPDTPAGALDEARELATYGDVFDPWEEAGDEDPGLVVDDRTTPQSGLVASVPEWGPRPRVLLAGPLLQVLPLALSAWAADGSVVLVRGGAADQTARSASEGVTVDARS
ncbi:MAG: TIGR03089 family protein [Actinomycetota bacterium]|nr:TIGR03089 family protein [Actinomycetota bacterium]